MGLEERNGASRTADHAAAGPSSAAGDRGVTEVFSAFLESTGGAVSSLVDIYGDRLRTSTKETVWKIGIAIIAGVAALLWIGSATLAAVRGLSGAIAFLLDGEPWLGDLAGGLLALVLAGGAIAAAASWSRRKQLRALELKYGQDKTNDAGEYAPGIPGSPAAAGNPTAAHGAARTR